MKGIIYCATNYCNNKKYIGQTKYTLDIRKNGHINDAKRNKGFLFHKALIKYNFDFSWEILESDVLIDELDTKEKFYIELYDTFNSEKGYNLTSGGGYCKKVKYSLEEINFIIENRRLLKGEKEILALFNINFSRVIKNVHSIRQLILTYISEDENKEIKFKIKSINTKNRFETEESRLNRSEAQKGKKWSEETKIKQRNLRLGFKHSEETKNKVKINNKRTIKFKDNEIRFILDSLKNKISKRKILISLNEIFGYSINITSTSIIDRIIKEIGN